MRNNAVIRYSDYTYQFHHSERVDYCVYGSGMITRTWRKTWREEVARPFIKDGKLTIKCGGKTFIVKHVVAEAFLPNYRKSDSVVCIDGNEWNCDMGNLQIYSKRKLGKITGGTTKKCRKVLVVNKRTGEKFQSNSVRTAAKKNALLIPDTTRLHERKSQTKRAG